MFVTIKGLWQKGIELYGGSLGLLLIWVDMFVQVVAILTKDGLWFMERSQDETGRILLS